VIGERTTHGGAMLFSLLKSAFGRKQKQADEQPLEERDDEELMLLYAQGEVRAFEILLNRHEKPLYNYILRSVKRQDIAEELLQEVFLRVVRSAPKYKQSAKFTTWLYTIARNLCIDRARKKSKAPELSLNEKIGGDEEGASHLDMLVDANANVSHMSYERGVFMDRLKEALAQLPEEQREVFLLKEVSGMKFREIAEVVDAPVPTVKSRMRYALEALRAHLAQYEDVRFDEEERVEVVPGGE
jgi:RNA polymerase sigma-70 factor (ECF subfamily)